MPLATRVRSGSWPYVGQAIPGSFGGGGGKAVVTNSTVDEPAMSRDCVLHVEVVGEAAAEHCEHDHHAGDEQDPFHRATTA